VDFSMIKADEASGKANMKGEGRRAKGEGMKTSTKAESAKTASNAVRNTDNPEGNKKFAVSNAIDAENKDKSGMPKDTLSLNAFTSNHIEQGGRSGMGANKGGSGSFGSTERGGGGGLGLSGEGGEGKSYDYGYVRDAVMKNLKYPEKARRFGWEGKVVLHFVINEAGSIRDVRILRSSGVQMLDEAAKDALARVAAFRNKYNGLVTVQLPIEFRLKQ